MYQIRIKVLILSERSVFQAIYIYLWNEEFENYCGLELGIGN
jgi:hypothetical protein